ncbi:ATP-binding protein [uncultured Chitinophaga sp.]|jgi:Predicted ATPases|uniref:AAA family ATPase n=1 Tax=uncultured Chitinophaga sp. TaxID=339340 RepID=UPI002626F82C|nr:ATP-binding protein [uncultured Chitinophaga sp.]
MIIDFSVGNYRSFNDVQTLSLKATSLTSPDEKTDDLNIVDVNDTRLLKIVGIYGANASGKSNIVAALHFFHVMVSRSMESENIIKQGLNPYRLTSNTLKDSGFFQIILLLEGRRYRYGFTLSPKFEIDKEWLFGPAEKNETYYFKREGNQITTNPEYFREGSGLPLDKVRGNALFLAFCTTYDGPVSKTVRDFITNQMIFENTLSPFPMLKSGYPFGSGMEKTNQLIADGKKEIVLSYLKDAGLSYNDISIEKIELTKDLKYDLIKVSKQIFDKDDNVTGTTQMDLKTDESQGTNKFYNYIGDLYYLFSNGGVFISDEIDSNFHPALLKHLISLFQNPKINVANAQVIFSSHDVNLMAPDFMRRDQFYFTEKTVYDNTRLYSLADLKGIRNNVDFARHYLAGFYGALPHLGNLI